MNNDLLETLTLPGDIKKLSIEEQTKLCTSIRKKIIATVSKNGGHLSSNLGVVELTVALHKVFDSPDDKIIFDVGHQCYAHKILTGRYKDFDTLRQKDGISGFPKPNESEHDPMICGHSSTSVSAALGIAQAMKLRGDNHHAVAVIGDGSLTGGLAYEGLNNAGKSKTNLVVVVNYNEMSISKNIGGIAEYLSKLRIKKSYRNAKNATKKFLRHVPLVGKQIMQSVDSFKYAVKAKMLHSSLFEDLGFEYIGPVNGHDLKELETALEAAKSLNAPVIVQVNTIKGKGYKPAEDNPGQYHSVKPSNGSKENTQAQSFSAAFGNALAKAAENDERICAITAAMKQAVGLYKFSRYFPERFFDVGIAEEHAVTFAAGLAREGMIPVFAVYSTFLQRSYDQILHDLSIAGLHAVIVECNCGVVGQDGETHQGLFDVPFLTSIPNVRIYSPSSCSEIELCLNKALYDDKNISVIRCPVGSEVLKAAYESDIYSECELSNGNALYSCGSNTVVVSYGKISNTVQRVCAKLGADHLKLLNIFPIDDDIANVISRYENAFMFEECSEEGSIGQKLKANAPKLKTHAVRGFVQQMSVEEALDECGLSEDKIEQQILNEAMVVKCKDLTLSLRQEKLQEAARKQKNI